MKILLEPFGNLPQRTVQDFNGTYRFAKKTSVRENIDNKEGEYPH